MNGNAARYASYVDTTFTTALSSNDEFKKYSLTRIPAGRWALPGMESRAGYHASRVC